MFNKKKRQIQELEKEIDKLRKQLADAHADRDLLDNLIIKMRQSMSHMDWMPENIKAGRIVFNAKQEMRKIVDMGNDKFHLTHYSPSKQVTVFIEKIHIPEEGLNSIDLFKYLNKSEYYPFFLGNFEK